MEATLATLAKQTVSNYEKKEGNSAKYFIGLAATPGAGKTTLANKVCSLINQLHPGM